MTDKRSSWTNGDVLYGDDLADSIYANRWFKVLNRTDVDVATVGVVGHSSTHYSVIGTDGDIWVTTDSGTNWTEKNTTFTTKSAIVPVIADRTYGIAIDADDTSNAASAYTSDSGVTWSNGGAVGNDNYVNDLSAPTTTLAVCCTDNNITNDNIYRSTDNGANWAAASTSPNVDVVALNMFDGTTGYATDIDDNIWKTTDSGDNWVDTGNDISGTEEGDTICCLSATTALITLRGSGYVYLYDDTANTTTLVLDWGTTTDAGYPTHFVKAVNNFIYFAVLNTSDIVARPSALYRTTDGLVWEIMTLPYSGEAEAGGTNNYTKYFISEGADNEILLLGSSVSSASPLFKIIER